MKKAQTTEGKVAARDEFAARDKVDGLLERVRRKVFVMAQMVDSDNVAHIRATIGERLDCLDDLTVEVVGYLEEAKTVHLDDDVDIRLEEALRRCHVMLLLWEEMHSSTRPNEDVLTVRMLISDLDNVVVRSRRALSKKWSDARAAA